MAFKKIRIKKDKTYTRRHMNKTNCKRETLKKKKDVFWTCQILQIHKSHSTRIANIQGI